MKRIPLFATAILFAVMFLASLSVKAQCPPNYTYYATTLQYSQDCLFDVSFCYICGTTSPGTVKHLQVYPSDPQGNNCPDYSEALRDWIHEEIMKIVWEECQFPPCSSETYQQYTIENPVCIKKINVTWREPDWTIHNQINWKFCSSGGAYCQHTYSACMDYGHTPPQLITTNRTCLFVGPLDCPMDEPQLPPPGYTWDEDWESSCFFNGDCSGTDPNCFGW